jgi:N utilization substance protein A
MNGDFIEALRAIEKEKEIPLEILIETVESALVTAYKKNFATTGDVHVRVQSSKTGFKVFCEKLVVDQMTNSHVEILLDEARRVDPDMAVGDFIEVEVTPEDFGRIAAQTAKQVVMQRIREAERDHIFDEYNEKAGEVVTGIVQRREQRNVFINIGKIEALLPASEQVPTEPYKFNDRIKVYILEVRKTPKGPQVIVSRTHPSLIRRLFELEVPEIHDGIVTLKSVAREAGSRSKIAVSSSDEKVDPVGACVGHRGSRVQAVVTELYDEKIDIIRWNEDASRFIAESLSPAKVVTVTVSEDAKSAFVIVPDNQLSLAIGKAGQNVRLAARLTGWRIDIRSEAQIARSVLTAEEPEAAPEADETAPEAVAESATEEQIVAESVVAEPETVESEVEEAVAEVADEKQTVAKRVRKKPVAAESKVEEAVASADGDGDGESDETA